MLIDALVATFITAMRSIDRRRHLGVAHRQCAPPYEVVVPPPSAPFSTRWVEKGGPPTLYLSSDEDGAWAELRKHAPDPDVEWSEVLRRIGAVRYDLTLVDLCDARVQAALAIDTHDLVRDDDLTVCRALAQAARTIGADGLISPSAALAGVRTIVVYEAGIGGLELIDEDVRNPPWV